MIGIFKDLGIYNSYLQYTLLIFIILISAYITSWFLRNMLGRFLKTATQKLIVDPTKFNFLKNGVSFTIYTLAIIFIFYSIPDLKSIGISLFAGAGIFAAIIGFASQQAFSNIISGIFIVIFEPFRVGDVIKIGTDIFGTVEDITLRHVVINGMENRRVVIPNSVISSQTIINSSITDEKICIFLEIGISYDSDIDLAMQIMQDEAMKHAHFIDNRTEEDKEKAIHPVIVRVISLGDFSVTLRANVWTKDSPTAFAMRCDLMKSIKEKFDKEGIEIPFPHRTLIIKKDVNKLISQEN